MQESVPINHFNGAKIDGQVRIRRCGTVLMLQRDDKGLQVNTIYDPAKQARKFGYFVTLTIINAKGKKQRIDADLCDLYRKTFRTSVLPAALKLAENSHVGTVSSKNNGLKPDANGQQLPLF